MKYDVVYLKEIDSDGYPDLVPVHEFRAENRDGAYEFIQEWNRTHSDRTYYYREHGNRNFGICHDDGIVTYHKGVYDALDVDDDIYCRITRLRIEYRRLKSLKTENPVELRRIGNRIDDVIRGIGRLRRLSRCGLYKKWIKVKVSVKDFMEWWFCEKWKCLWSDIRFWVFRTWKHIRTHHDPTEFWSLDDHVIDDIRWNTNELIRKGHGVPPNFMDEAVMEMNKDVPGFDLKGFWKTCPGVTPEMVELALRKRDEAWSRLIHTIDLYRFYSFNLGKGDEGYTEEDMVEIHFPGTYDDIDYRKMDEMATRYWNEVFRMFAEYGRGMWD